MMLQAILVSGFVHAQTYRVIYNFVGEADGANPNSGVTSDASGNLYGTTSDGGFERSDYCLVRSGCGTVYKLAQSHSSWILTPLYNFRGGQDGVEPLARVVAGPDGTLYGTTFAGGGFGCNTGSSLGCGTVFNLRPPARPCASTICPWTETVLYRFSGGVDGENPGLGDLVFDQAGNIYGTTESGGADNMGTVFKLSRTGNTWTESIIYSFTNQNDGRFPIGGVILVNGNLYGATECAGHFGFCVGTVIYELVPAGSGWTFNPLYTQVPPQGSLSYASLTADGRGSFFGTTYAGGEGNCSDSFGVNTGCGTVFHGALDGIFTAFNNPLNAPSLSGPSAPVTLDVSGNIYGTTTADGANGFGNIFKLTYQNGDWTYTSLHDFAGGTDGFYPLSSVSVRDNGNLYGTAYYGGTGHNCPTGANYGCGIIWQITP